MRELQPSAKFIITLSDPVQRLYSDYYFLEDNGSVARQNVHVSTTKSAQALHRRVLEQLRDMEKCIEQSIEDILTRSQGEETDSDNKGTGTGTNSGIGSGSVGDGVWFRASQM